MLTKIGFNAEDSRLVDVFAAHAAGPKGTLLFFKDACIVEGERDRIERVCSWGIRLGLNDLTARVEQAQNDGKVLDLIGFS